MKPYYEDDSCTIYHGDCHELLLLGDLESVDAIVSDPPYGMGYKPKRGSDGSKRFSEPVSGDSVPFDPKHLLVLCVDTILWGAHWYADKLPASGGWIVWDKTPRGSKRGFIASHCDLAWTNCRTRIEKIALQWGGEAHAGEEHLHPTQKPVPLMERCIGLLDHRELILDPYAGSGSTLLAARNCGLRAIGIEIDERYCEIAAKRLEQAVLF